jgi:putative serine protease PepD
MVSRKHAELRIENGQWMLVDVGSTYGTYINGQKIGQAQAISAGSTLQFGLDGPKLIVVWYETGDQPAPGPAVSKIESRNEPQIPAKPSSPPVQLPQAQLDIPGPPAKPSLTISRPTVWFGREADCDVIFDKTSTNRFKTSCRNCFRWCRFRHQGQQKF